MITGSEEVTQEKTCITCQPSTRGGRPYTIKPGADRRPKTKHNKTNESQPRPFTTDPPPVTDVRAALRASSSILFTIKIKIKNEKPGDLSQMFPYDHRRNRVRST